MELYKSKKKWFEVAWEKINLSVDSVEYTEKMSFKFMHCKWQLFFWPGKKIQLPICFFVFAWKLRSAWNYFLPTLFLVYWKFWIWLSLTIYNYTTTTIFAFHYFVYFFSDFLFFLFQIKTCPKVSCSTTEWHWEFAYHWLLWSFPFWNFILYLIT